jgi:hypothetical protein
VDELLGVAAGQLERIKVAISQLGLKYVDLAPATFGVGIGIAWGETEFVVLSIAGGGNENQLMMTSGVLRDVKQDRLAVLDACNRRNQNNSSYLFYLHDAEVGWDVLLQNTYPIELLLDVPPFFQAVVTSLPRETQEARTQFAEEWSFGGEPYRWNDDGVARLLLRSMI